jgi:predicted SprT family Zn-dependent metalloprotease
MATNAKGLRRVSFSAVFEKFKLVCERKWDMDKVLKDRHLIHPNGRGAQKEVSPAKLCQVFGQLDISNVNTRPAFTSETSDSENVSPIIVKRENVARRRVFIDDDDDDDEEEEVGAFQEGGMERFRFRTATSLMVVDDDDEDEDFQNMLKNRGVVVANVKHRFQRFLEDDDEEEGKDAGGGHASEPEDNANTPKKAFVFEGDDDGEDLFTERPLCVYDEDDDDCLSDDRHNEPGKKVIVLSDSEDEDRDTDMFMPLRDRLKRQPATMKSLSAVASPKKKCTPAKWKKARVRHARELFEEYNHTVFQGKLPADMSIEWSKRLNKTAGLTYTQYGDGDRKHIARIELSSKVLTDMQRTRATLLHEMCHAACWIIDGVRKPPHGKAFKKWASHATNKYPDDAVTTCHNYKIHYKFQWECASAECDWKCGRHSKSVSEERHRCGRCGAKIVFLGKFDSNGDPVKARPETAYSAFKKNMTKYVKAENPEYSFGDVQRRLAALWKEQKAKG